jgi:hypothetical protein
MVGVSIHAADMGTMVPGGLIAASGENVASVARAVIIAIAQKRVGVAMEAVIGTGAVREVATRIGASALRSAVVNTRAKPCGARDVARREIVAKEAVAKVVAARQVVPIGRRLADRM